MQYHQQHTCRHSSTSSRSYSTSPSSPPQQEQQQKVSGEAQAPAQEDPTTTTTSSTASTTTTSSSGSHQPHQQPHQKGKSPEDSGAAKFSKEFIAGKLSQEELWMAGVGGRLKIWARSDASLKVSKVLSNSSYKISSLSICLFKACLLGLHTSHGHEEKSAKDASTRVFKEKNDRHKN
jgi:hypothetical protein